MIDPETKITVVLTAVQWNTVLMQLAEGRWNLMDPLMKAIQFQCQQADPQNDQNVQVLSPSGKREYPKDIQAN